MKRGVPDAQHEQHPNQVLLYLYSNLRVHNRVRLVDHCIVNQNNHPVMIQKWQSGTIHGYAPQLSFSAMFLCNILQCSQLYFLHRTRMCQLWTHMLYP